MTDKLNDNDKQRIEQEAKRVWKDFNNQDRIIPDLLIDMGMYATIYERGQQANGLKSIENPDHHIKVLKEQIQRMEKEYKELEAERSEVQQQVETLTKENEDLMHGQDKQAVDLVKLLDIIDEYEELLKMTLLRVRDSSLYKDIRASLRGVWNEDEPYKNGKYQVLVLMCDKPYEEKEDIDEYKDGYWLGYAQFVLGWKHLSRKQQREEALEAERSNIETLLHKILKESVGGNVPFSFELYNEIKAALNL